MDKKFVDYRDEDNEPENLKRLLEKDGLIQISEEEALTSDAHIIACVTGHRKFHFYRKESNGLWTHKEGSEYPDDDHIVDIKSYKELCENHALELFKTRHEEKYAHPVEFKDDSFTMIVPRKLWGAQIFRKHFGRGYYSAQLSYYFNQKIKNPKQLINPERNEFVGFFQLPESGLQYRKMEYGLFNQ